jgi:hypothetical protein
LLKICLSAAAALAFVIVDVAWASPQSSVVPIIQELHALAVTEYGKNPAQDLVQDIRFQKLAKALPKESVPLLTSQLLLLEIAVRHVPTALAVEGELMESDWPSIIARSQLELSVQDLSLSFYAELIKRAVMLNHSGLRALALYANLADVEQRTTGRVSAVIHRSIDAIIENLKEAKNPLAKKHLQKAEALKKWLKDLNCEGLL